MRGVAYQRRFPVRATKKSTNTLQKLLMVMTTRILWPMPLPVLVMSQS